MEVEIELKPKGLRAHRTIAIGRLTNFSNLGLELQVRYGFITKIEPTNLLFVQNIEYEVDSTQIENGICTLRLKKTGDQVLADFQEEWINQYSFKTKFEFTKHVLSLVKYPKTLNKKSK